MIQERLIFGIRNTSHSDCPQINHKLTLKKAKKTICQREVVQKQQILLQKKFGANEQSSIDSMQTRPKEYIKSQTVKIKKPNSGNF